MSVVGPHLVFVYGTLKRGCRNHGWMEGALFVGEAATKADYQMYDLGGYPGLYLEAQRGRSVRGELWRVDDEGLARLDILEDVDGGDYVHAKADLLPPWDHVKPLIYLCKLPHQGCPNVGEEWLESP